MGRGISRRQFLKSAGVGITGICINPLINEIMPSQEAILYLENEENDITRANIIYVKNNCYYNDLNCLNILPNNEKNTQYMYSDRYMLLTNTNLKEDLEAINMVFNEVNLESGYRAIIRNNDHFECFNITGYGKHRSFYSITTDFGEQLTDISKENILIIEPKEKIYLSYDLLKKYNLSNQKSICLKLNR